MAKRIVTFALLFLTLAASLSARTDNRLIPFQGRLTDGSGKALNGVYTFLFNIYDEPTGGTSLWSETHQNVSVIAGQVNVILGSMTSLDDPKNRGNSNPLYFTQPRYLGITIGSDSNQEMLPRHQLVPSFQARISDRAFKSDHALKADNADKLGNRLPSHFVAQSNLNDVSSDLNGKISTNSSEIATAKAAIQNLMPAGAVLPFAGGNVPTGFLEANGQYVNKTTYAALYAAIGNAYGATPSDFKLPDYRGYFLRGWDHGRGIGPDRGSRENRGDGNTGDVVGTVQNDAFQGHWHSVSTSPNLARMHDYHGRGGSDWTMFAWDATVAVRDPINGSHGSVKVSSETRPKNISVMYIIKY